MGTGVRNPGQKQEWKPAWPFLHSIHGSGCQQAHFLWAQRLCSWSAPEGLLITLYYWYNVLSLALRRRMKPFLHPVWAKGKMERGGRAQGVTGPVCFLGGSLVLRLSPWAAVFLLSPDSQSTSGLPWICPVLWILPFSNISVPMKGSVSGSVSFLL